MRLKAARFVSLKWKVVLLTSISLTIATIAFSGINYLEMHSQFQDRREIAYQLYTQQIAGLIGQNRLRLQQLGAMVASLPEVRKALTTGDAKFAHADLEEFWPTLLLNLGVEALSVNNRSGQLLVNMGAEQDAESIRGLIDVVSEVVEKEQPAVWSRCLPKCMEIIVAPVLGDGKSVGTVVLGASLIDTILGFHQLTRSDMGLISDTSQRTNTTVDKNWLPMWNMRVEAMSNRERSLNILQKASEQYSFKEMSEFSTILNFENLTYEVRLTIFPGFTQPNPPHIVLITDITDAIGNIRETTAKNIVLGIASILGSGILIVGFLWRPLQRLRLAAENLPLLAQGKFEKIKGIMVPDQRSIRDEIDVLEDTTVQTATRLESLNNVVLERNHTLSLRMQELRIEKDFATRILDTAQAIILTHNDKNGIVLLNQYGESLTGYSNKELLGKPFVNLLSENNILPDIQNRLSEIFEGKRDRFRLDSEVKCKDGSTRSIVWHHSSLSDPENNMVLSVGLDITDRKKAESRLSWLANRDPLTSVFNRHRFHEELINAVARAKRYGHEGALLFLDLDKFKYINDTSGHHYGDLIIREVGKKLIQILRQDVDIVGRVGGDEFAIILPEAAANEAEKVAGKLLMHLADINVSTSERPHKISASIGISLFPKHGTDVQVLLTAADLAMYKVKDSGRGGWHIYSPEDQSLERLRKRVLWKDCIQNALEKKLFTLYFQPIMNVSNSSINCYEALLRIFDEDGDIIPTTTVIKIAEQEGLIKLLDRSVLRAAINYQAELSQLGLQSIFFINLSPLTFDDPSLVSFLRELLINTHTVSQNLVLEITETAALSDLRGAKDLIMSIKNLGCRFALDDFGVGFSSFHHLLELPLDIVKIDGSYIQRLAESQSNRTLVNVINEISHGRKIETVAEYVENADTLKILKNLHVDYAQGHYIGHPAPASELFGNIPLSAEKRRSIAS